MKIFFILALVLVIHPRVTSGSEPSASPSGSSLPSVLPSGFPSSLPSDFPSSLPSELPSQSPSLVAVTSAPTCLEKKVGMMGGGGMRKLRDAFDRGYTRKLKGMKDGGDGGMMGGGGMAMLKDGCMEKGMQGMMG